MCDEEEDENKVFMFTGFNLDKAKEKEDLIDKLVLSLVVSILIQIKNNASNGLINLLQAILC